MASPSRVYWFHVILTTNTDQSLSQVGLYSRRAEYRRKVGTEIYKTCWTRRICSIRNVEICSESKKEDKFQKF